ncbi:MAG: restriction endonuclease subunit S [Elusimicrobia bacterium]|nr:restriction endonuclease subunit S [Elusimicrobiota bacterium]
MPKNWETATIADVCEDTQYGYTTSASDMGEIHLLRTTDITSGKIDWDTVPFCKDVPAELNKYLLKNGDVVISRAGSVGYSFLIENPEKAVFASYLIRFIPRINNKYFAYFLKSPFYWNHILEKSIGIALANVNATKLKNIPIPISPLPEQKRIVRKIEELFKELDEGVEILEKMQGQIKQYRQSVLKQAFEGRLTNKNIKNRKLPKHWILVKLGDTVKKVEKINRRKIDDEYVFKYLDIGSIDNSTNKIISYKEYKWKNAPSRAQQILKYRDILFSTVRTYLKNIAQVADTKFNDQIGSTGFTVIRTRQDILLPEYLFQYVLSDKLIQPLNDLQTGSSYPAVRDSDVFNQIIPICSIKEQHQIVREIESRFALADELEKTVEWSLTQAETLRQSILKNAFEGKLVPQNSKDEPAEILLERIKKQKDKKN